MTSDLKTVAAVATAKPRHLIPGGVKRPKPYRQHACENKQANQKEELGSYRLPVNLAEQLLNSAACARTARLSVAWFVLNHQIRQ